MSVEDKIELALKVVRLRHELKEAEAALAGESRPTQRQRTGPSIADRVLNLIREAGPAGLQRRDILAIIPNEGAVHSALKAHQSAGRIHSAGGAWRAGTDRPTREMRVPQVPVGLDEEPR